MVYTCFDMIRDCRANVPDGWSYFITNYVPSVRTLLGHYRPEHMGALDTLLMTIGAPDAGLFSSLKPLSEREFLLALRQNVLEALDRAAPWPQPEVGVELEALTQALEAFTLVERQVVWLETMNYTVTQAGTMLRMAPATAQKIRDTAGDRIRGRIEAWRQTVLSENGRFLGRAAYAAATPGCLASKAFLDVIDGRTTWLGREELERHVRGCWHCIDHFSRSFEAVELVRLSRPLNEQEAERFRKLLGLRKDRRPAWKRLFGGA
ncbi:MAG: hypothetical protein JO323_15475 [Acidobacteriia bacterium]|nr:hypothetical protein [Terriglobia bacterium]